MPVSSIRGNFVLQGTAGNAWSLFGCHNWECNRHLEGKGQLFHQPHPTMHRMFPRAKNFPVQNVNHSQGEKPWPTPTAHTRCWLPNASFSLDLCLELYTGIRSQLFYTYNWNNILAQDACPEVSTIKTDDNILLPVSQTGILGIICVPPSNSTISQIPLLSFP